MKNVIWGKRYLFVKPTKMICPNKFCQPSAYGRLANKDLKDN